MAKFLDPGLLPDDVGRGLMPGLAKAVTSEASVATSLVRVSMLGGFSVDVDGQRVPAREWRRRQAAALVKILALTPGRSMHRERVIDAIWPDLDLETAAPRLHKAAHYARRSLGDPGSLVLGGDVVSLYPNATVEVDALRFQSAAESALDRRDPLQAATAADQYGGELLPDDVYEPWSDEPRDRLHLLHVDVLHLAGRWQSLVTADPTNEEAHLTLMRELAAAGDDRAALLHFERLERDLSRELGLAPSKAAIGLRDGLKVGPDAFAADPLPSGANMLDRDEDGSHVGLAAATRIAGDGRSAPVLEVLSDLRAIKDRIDRLLGVVEDIGRERAGSGQHGWPSRRERRPRRRRTGSPNFVRVSGFGVRVPNGVPFACAASAEA